MSRVTKRQNTKTNKAQLDKKHKYREGLNRRKNKTKGA